jgi:hypothetical protein
MAITPAEHLQGFSAMDLASPVSVAINVLKAKLISEIILKR